MLPCLILAILVGLVQPLVSNSGYKRILDSLLEEQRLQLHKRCGTETASRGYVDHQYSISINDALQGQQWTEPKRTKRASSESVLRKAAYFNGEVAAFRENEDRPKTNRKPTPVSVQANLPVEEFTAEVWVKPEGGQNNPCVIIGKI